MTTAPNGDLVKGFRDTARELEREAAERRRTADKFWRAARALDSKPRGPRRRRTEVDR